MDSSTKRLAEQHKQKIALIEKQALQQKQQLLRGKATSSLCTMNPNHPFITGFFPVLSGDVSFPT